MYVQPSNTRGMTLIIVHGGLHADLNATYPVGKCDQESLDLIEATRKSVEESIAICKPGVPYRDIGNKIEEIIKPKGYGIVRRYTGHGVHKLVSRIPPGYRGGADRQFHCQPNIVHYGGSKTPGRMEAGQVFTIVSLIFRFEERC
jgi:methionyl aminopeptidase